VNEIEDEIAYTEQGSLQKTRVLGKLPDASICVCKVIQVFADRNTCTLKGLNGSTVYNVAVLTKAGLIDGKYVWGELDLPNVGSYVLVGFVENRMEKPFIIGTVIPYGHDKYQSAQNPVNSGSKAYTKKLLETGKEKYYRRIFQSGTTVEIADDGSVIVEAPDGMYIQMDATANKVIINGNLEVLK